MDMNTGEFGYGLFMLPSIHCSRSIVVRICSAGYPPCFQPFRCCSPWLGESAALYTPRSMRTTKRGVARFQANRAAVGAASTPGAPNGPVALSPEHAATAHELEVDGVAQDVAFARLACAFFSVILARVLRIFEVDWERNLAPHLLSTRLLPMPLLLFLPVPLPLPCPLSPSFDQQRNED
ncbi:hypothetical protein TGME49_220125 [Toxoplasma gondii ME49]|uniref:Uncharacterized protein n=1 Tax=Toxoplasma gondii (strain ATCC 50611 / Me49) TaxID=508771 RepID=S8GR99_TOXGM|nr:hypothetical protein TGME49_220125 [Toxoplasma gondii ME49]EPT31109.1 hypothetical protein TGME49_220125 [Toxoplasma gondii ME49]|eukprot:XP_018637822.1 hypothetical protein TGME49_220125 [Toxoplasma gondii ME49]